MKYRTRTRSLEFKIPAENLRITEDEFKDCSNFMLRYRRSFLILYMLKRTEDNYFRQTVISVPNLGQSFLILIWFILQSHVLQSHVLLFRRGKLRCILRCTLVWCNGESYSHVRFPKRNVFLLYFYIVSHRYRTMFLYSYLYIVYNAAHVAFRTSVTSRCFTPSA